jgi:hypothetical protein
MGEKDNVRSISERAADETEAGEQVEAFPMGSLEGDGKTLKNIIKSGLPVELTVSMRAAEVPIRGGGLPDPDSLQRCFVTAEVAKYEPVPVRDDGKIVSWKIRCVLRPTYVEPQEASGSVAV